MMLPASIRRHPGVGALGVSRMYALRGLRGLGASQADIIAMIQSAAAAAGVPPQLAVAVAQHESSLNQAAVGTSGELGVFQLMPGTAAQLGVDPSNLQQNIQGGVTYLSQMHSLTGNWNDALIAYNEGPGAWSSGNRYSQSQNYASAILAAANLPSDSGAATATAAADGGSQDDTGQTMPITPAPMPTATGFGTAGLLALGIVAVLFLTD